MALICVIFSSILFFYIPFLKVCKQSSNSESITNYTTEIQCSWLLLLLQFELTFKTHTQRESFKHFSINHISLFPLYHSPLFCVHHWCHINFSWCNLWQKKYCYGLNCFLVCTSLWLHTDAVSCSNIKLYPYPNWASAYTQSIMKAMSASGN